MFYLLLLIKLFIVAQSIGEKYCQALYEKNIHIPKVIEPLFHMATIAHRRLKGKEQKKPEKEALL